MAPGALNTVMENAEMLKSAAAHNKMEEKSRGDTCSFIEGRE